MTETPTPEELLERTLVAARRTRITHPRRTAAEQLARVSLERAQAKKERFKTHRARALTAAAVAAALLVGTFIGTESTSAPNPADQVAHAPLARTNRSAVESDDSHIPLVAPNDPIEPSAGPTLPATPSTQLVLASGDRLLSSPGSSFEVLSDEGDRVVDLESGDVLFDVVHREGETFSVRVGDVRVEVLGTVFSVMRRGDRVAVRVFEGLVAVHDEESLQPRRVDVDETWVSGNLDGLDAWRQRSEEQWQTVAPDGVREPGRGADSTRLTPTETPEVVPNPTIGEAQALLSAGDLEALLNLCERSDNTGLWRLYRADALQGLRRLSAAAEEYEQAAEELHGMRRIQAAFAAAQLYSEERPEHAVALLRRYDVVSRRSALEERARSLEVRLLERLGRRDEQRTAQASYEARFGAELATE